MALNPGVYAELLGKKIAQHNVQVWLVNTGWSGGPYGVGQRMKLGYTRAMISAALNGTLAQVPMGDDPFFRVQVPQTCPDVPPEVLQPRKTWKDPQAYDVQARKLAGMFMDNFKQFANDVSADVRAAGPHTA